MLMKGSVTDIVIVTVTSLIGIWLVCAAMVGYFTRLLTWSMRLAFVVAGIMLLLPHQASALMMAVNVVGFVLGIALLAYEWRARPRAGSAVPADQRAPAA
jgi:TRAP-type uncharacterized transport system fused permease subunit